MVKSHSEGRSELRVHILLPFGSNDWPFVQNLRNRWPDATFGFGGWTSRGYKSRWDVLWRNLQLFIFGFRSAIGIHRQDPSVQAVIVFSDMEMLGFAFAGFFTRFRPPIVLHGFIYTSRKSRALNLIRRAYFYRILTCARGVICHSDREKNTYAELFRLRHTQFFSVPYGTHVNAPPNLCIEDGGYAFSAGRSGRDYELLASVFKHIEFPLRIACDSAFALKDINFPANVSVLRDCRGDDYLRELAGAQFVVIPIKDDEVSSGQMVLINAMAFGKATVITKTKTTAEYGVDDETLLFVEIGSQNSLQEAVTKIANDEVLRERLGRNAVRQYETRYSMASFAFNTANVVETVVKTYLNKSRK